MRPLKGSRRLARGIGRDRSKSGSCQPLGDGLAVKTERASNLGDGQALTIPAVADLGERLVVDHDRPPSAVRVALRESRDRSGRPDFLNEAARRNAAPAA